MPRYGVEETNSIELHEFTETCDLLVMIKDNFRNTWYLNRLHMLNIAPHPFLPFRCIMLGPYIFSSIPESSLRVGLFFRMLLSTAQRVCFIGWQVMIWNHLVQSALFMLWALYPFFYSSTCGMGERELLTMVCTSLFLRRWLISL